MPELQTKTEDTKTKVATPVEQPFPTFKFPNSLVKQAEQRSGKNDDGTTYEYHVVEVATLGLSQRLRVDDETFKLFETGQMCHIQGQIQSTKAGLQFVPTQVEKLG